MNNEFRLKLYKTFIDNDFDSFLYFFSLLNYKDKKDFFQKPFTHDNQKQILVGHYIDSIRKDNDFLKKANLNFLKVLFRFPVMKRSVELQKKLHILNDKIMLNFCFNNPNDSIAFQSFLYLNDYMQKFGDLKRQEEMTSMFAFLSKKDNFLHIIKNYKIYEPYINHNWTPHFVYDFLDRSNLYNHKEIDFIFDNYPPLKNMDKETIASKIEWVQLDSNICYILQLHANYNNYSMLDYYNIEDFPHIAPLIEHEIISNHLKEEKNTLVDLSSKDTEINVKRKRL